MDDLKICFELFKIQNKDLFPLLLTLRNVNIYVQEVLHRSA